MNSHEAGSGQASLGRHAVDFRLHAHVRRRLELEVPSLLVALQLARKRALDVPRPRVVAFDEVAVVGVHDAHETGEIGGRARMKRLTERRRGRCKFGHEIGNRLGRILETGRLDALDGLERRLIFGR